MSNHNHLAEKIENKFQKKDERRKKKMKVSGKSVFRLKKIITRKVGG
jgi:hypothetical protein